MPWRKHNRTFVLQLARLSVRLHKKVEVWVQLCLLLEVSRVRGAKHHREQHVCHGTGRLHPKCQPTEIAEAGSLVPKVARSRSGYSNCYIRAFYTFYPAYSNCVLHLPKQPCIKCLWEGTLLHHINGYTPLFCHTFFLHRQSKSTVSIACLRQHSCHTYS